MQAGRRLLPLLSLLALALAACAPAARPPEAATAPSPPQAPAAQSPAGAAPKPAPKVLSADHFAGKTVTLLVGFSPGGPSDVFARLVAQHLKKYVPGNPNMIVEHKPGAGGIVALNHIYSAARKDGLTLGALGLIEDRQIMGAEGVQYDATQFVWLGGAVESQVGFIHPGLGVRTALDLPRASQEIVAGGLTPESSKDIGTRTFFNLIGVPYKYVTGYPGNADARLAFQRGEINYYEESLTGWVTGIVPLVEQGNAVNLGQRGIPRAGAIIRDPRVPDLPTYLEIAAELRGDSIKQSVEYRAMVLASRMGAMQRALVYPPGVSPEVADAMREAVASMFADEEFQTAAQKQFGFLPEFVPGPQALETSQQIIKTASEDPEPLEYLKRLTKG